MKTFIALLLATYFSGCINTITTDIHLEREGNVSLVPASAVQTDFEEYMNLGGIELANYFIRYQPRDSRYNEQVKFFSEANSSQDYYLKFTFSSNYNLKSRLYNTVIHGDLQEATTNKHKNIEVLEEINSRIETKYIFNLYLSVLEAKRFGFISNDLIIRDDIYYSIDVFEPVMVGDAYKFISNRIDINKTELQNALDQLPR